MSEQKQGLMPRLRFPEFREAGEWENSELGPLSTKVGSGITPTGGNKNYKTEGRPFVRSQNVGWGELLLDDIVFIDEKTHNSFDSTEIQESDVLLNITGASIGRSAIADSRIAGGNVNQHVCIIRVKTRDLNPVFLNQFLISERGQNQIDSFQAGGNRQGLNFAQIRSFVIPRPPSKQEQRKVADCISSLDTLIAAQADKLDALKTHKKGLMQQLFPREGETVPRLRFPEFREAGDWEETKLGNLCDMRAGQFVPATAIDDNHKESFYPCYGGNGLRGFTKTHTHSGKYPLIGRQGALCGNITLANGKFHATEHAVVATPNEGVNVDWLFFELALLNLNRFATGQAQPGLSVEVLNQVECVTPKKEAEQKKIADFLSSIDALIAAQADKLDALKTHKRGLMQQLFPNPEAVAA